MTTPIYNLNTEVRIITAGGHYYGGRVLKQAGDWLTILDRKSQKRVTVNLLRIESVQVVRE